MTPPIRSSQSSSMPPPALTDTYDRFKALVPRLPSPGADEVQQLLNSISKRQWEVMRKVKNHRRHYWTRIVISSLEGAIAHGDRERIDSLRKLVTQFQKRSTKHLTKVAEHPRQIDILHYYVNATPSVLSAEINCTKLSLLDLEKKDCALLIKAVDERGCYFDLINDHLTTMKSYIDGGEDEDAENEAAEIATLCERALGKVWSNIFNKHGRALGLDEDLLFHEEPSSSHSLGSHSISRSFVAINRWEQ